MAGNPKDSEWYSLSQDERGHKKVGFTLSDAARAKLAALSKRWRLAKSAVLERLIMDAQIESGKR
jgi:hypothetical protein